MISSNDNVFTGVCLSTGGNITCILGHVTPLWDALRPWDTLPPPIFPPVLTSSDGHRSRRYAFFWNTFSFVSAAWEALGSESFPTWFVGARAGVMIVPAARMHKNFITTN